jgi:hypothetical protein
MKRAWGRVSSASLASEEKRAVKFDQQENYSKQRKLLKQSDQTNIKGQSLPRVTARVLPLSHEIIIGLFNLH